ncbi:transcriptional regulator FeaR [Acinetobacter sp. ANC 4558]|uniref:transcriptional regulator FeaR n=1 Tax=Acinetobacter sp. ANC 4558 TaxID=1977876 RepID=UPI000A335EE3|nr:transcriptional regulator FeaR [Acinetobacter sp. ANC 4558]OTG88275.1 transcriptional regulator FeaR [Acinetobacter sp. ANC 4558]
MNTYINNAVMAWKRELQNVCGDFEIAFDMQNSLFIGDIKSFLLGETEIAFIKSNANYICRNEGISDRAKDRFCFLILQYTGKMKIDYQGQTITLNEGDIVLLDSEEKIEMYPQGLFSHISVHLYREKLYKQGINENHFGKLITSNMSGHLLKGMLQNLSPINIELWYAKEDENAFEDALIALIKPTINYKNIEILDHLNVKAERFIVEHLEQPNLNSQMVADYLGISIRHLFRLFENKQQTVHQYIQTQRLEKIKYELRDVNNKDVSISDIALKYGFSDSAHFSKLFRKIIGISPREYRISD